MIGYVLIAVPIVNTLYNGFWFKFMFNLTLIWHDKKKIGGGITFKEGNYSKRNDVINVTFFILPVISNPTHCIGTQWSVLGNSFLGEEPKLMLWCTFLREIIMLGELLKLLIKMIWNNNNVIIRVLVLGYFSFTLRKEHLSILVAGQVKYESTCLWLARGSVKGKESTHHPYIRLYKDAR